MRPFARPDGLGPAILLLQNGMGSAEVARHAMGPQTLIYSTALMIGMVLKAIIFPRSAGHRSSMVQDLEAGRPTEIDFLNGAVVGFAKQQGLDAPFHRSIVSLIHAREMV
ncbi:MAG: hypothetical protein Rhims3KO_11100 [Hyphomicrobiales bacterium]